VRAASGSTVQVEVKHEKAGTVRASLTLA